MANRTVVTLIADGTGRCDVIANNRSENFRSVDAALTRAREILDVHPDEQAAYDKAMTSPSQGEEGEQGARPQGH